MEPNVNSGKHFKKLGVPDYKRVKCLESYEIGVQRLYFFRVN